MMWILAWGPGGGWEIGNFPMKLEHAESNNFAIRFRIFQPLQDCFHRSMGLSHFLGIRLRIHWDGWYLLETQELLASTLQINPCSKG